MKLAFLISHPIQYYAPLFRALAAHRDVDLTVYFATRYGIDEQKDPEFGTTFKWDIPLLEGYNFVFLKNYSPTPHNPSSPLWTVAPGIVSALRREKYDAIYIHGYNQVSHWLGFIGAWLSRTPIIFHGESILSSSTPSFKKILKNLILKPLFGTFSAFLPIGTKNKEFYELYGVSVEKLFLAPYSVDTKYFIDQAEVLKNKKAQFRLKENIPENANVILFSGKLIEKKRPLDLLLAYELFIKKNKEGVNPTFLVFVGDGPLRKSLEKYALEKKLINTRFVGFKNQSEISKYYSLSNLFVLPSGAGETWGLVVNEAMCFSLPIIVSNIVGCGKDLVEKGVNGNIFSVGNANELADVIQEIFQNEKKAKRMGEQSRKKIETWTIAETVEGFYNAAESVIKLRKN